MKCYFHEDTNAVAYCQHCGKALCKSCASKYNPCLCDECFELRQISTQEERRQRNKDALIDTNAEFIGAVIKGLIGAVVLTLIFNALYETPVPFGMSVMFFFVPFGWAFITYIEQWLPVFIVSGIVLIFWIICKLVLSMLLGIPCFLYQVFKYIGKLLTQKYR